MTVIARVRSWLRHAWGRSAMERDMADELAFHVDARAADLEARGLSRETAIRQARLEFGGLEGWKDDCRQARGLQLADDLRADLRYAARTLLRTPAFTLTAIVSLALGIGVNTIVFSVVNALVLKPLQVERPQELVFLQSNLAFPSHSFPNYRDLRDQNVSFAGLVGYRIAPINLESVGAPVRTWGYLATGNYFDVLGVEPALGRFFHQEDDLHQGDAPVAVLSHDAWTTRFGADPQVLGRTVRLNRTPFTIIGVAPKGFRGTELFYRPDIWVPMMMQPRIEVGNPWLDSRLTANTWVLGRLKPRVTIAAATADLDRLAAQLAKDFPRQNAGLRLRLTRPGLVGDTLGAPVRAFTLGVLGLAGLVLLTACANLASVLAARGADRRRELAIRLSIGAGRGRILRQLLTETLLISTTGGAVACGLAFGAARALSAWHAPVDVPIQFDIAVDTRVLWFACAVSTAAGLLFGLAPARQAARTDPNTALKDGAQAGAAGRWPLRDVLVSVQVALSVVLVSACVVSLRGLQRAGVMTIGIDVRDVTMVGFDLGLAGYSKADGAALQRRVLDAVVKLPGVQSAAYSNSLPLSIDQSSTMIFPDDRPELTAANALAAVRYEVSPGFFQTLGIHRELGRDLDWRDRSGVPRVAVVNATFARRVMRARDVVGRHFSYGFRADPIEIVGVVEDGKYLSLTEAPRAAVFEPILQTYNATTTLIVRSPLPPEQVLSAMRQAVAAIDPSLPLYGAGTVRQMLGLAMFPNQAAAVALTVFGVLALLLAATGIHGVVAYAVSRRRREIGIRIAIGARSPAVLRLVLGRIVTLLAAGAAVGLVLAVVAGVLLSGVVYGASARDPLVLGTVAALMLTVGAVACWAPARKSVRIEPMSALRPE